MLYVPVEVGTDTVEDLAAELILLPLDGVELEHRLVHQVHPLLQLYRMTTTTTTTMLQESALVNLALQRVILQHQEPYEKPLRALKTGSDLP